MKKTLDQMLQNPEHVGVGDIVEFITRGYEKPKRDVERLLDAYVSSVSKNEFTKGYFCACATLERSHGDLTLVKELVDMNRRTKQELITRGVDMDDIDVLAKYLSKS